jgi:hypothetical protein
MNPNTDPNIELLRIVRMLEKTVELAQEAHLTHNLADRSAAAIRTYNATVKHLVDTGVIPAFLFSPLAEDDSFTDVGVASAQLAEYLSVGLPEPAREEEKTRGAPKYSGLVITRGGGADKDEIARTVREHLAEWLRELREEQAPSPADQPETAARAAQTPSSPGVTPSGSRRVLPAQQAGVEPGSERREEETPR